MYKYQGFGLKIASEIEFPELLPSDLGDADITITVGKTPEKLEGDGVLKKAFSSVSKDEYLLHVKNICNFYACRGRQIVVEPMPGIDEHSIRTFLLGTVMAATLYQRGDISLHSAAVIHAGRLILFAGNSGAGKSTLLAALVTKGYKVFTDDICVLRLDPSGTKEILGTASYPMIKLWDDAISKLDNDEFNREYKIRPQLPKYGQFFYDRFEVQSMPVDKIFILVPQSDLSAISVTRLVAAQAFKEAEKQAYKRQLITDTQLRSTYFSLMLHLTNKVPIYKVSRPAINTNVGLLVDTIEPFFNA